ncbi:unnamed protein product, partial [marine sediment metagenome]
RHGGYPHRRAVYANSAVLGVIQGGRRDADR